MSVIDWVKHSLPMKLKDGKRHVFPTLASMVYLKDGTTPITDGNGNWNADKALDAEKLGGHEPSHYETAIDATLKNSGEAADAKITGDKFSQLSEQTVDYRTAVNLIDNPAFEIAQDGYNAYHCNDLYTADRWLAVHISIEVSGDTKTLTAKNAYSFTQQKLWTDGRGDGKAYTLAIIKADGTYIVRSGVIPQGDVTVQAFVASVYFTDNASICLIKDPDGSVSARIAIEGAGNSASFKAITLYEGSYTVENLPPYVPKGYANELLACEVAERGNVFAQLSQQKANESIISDEWTAGVYTAGAYCIHNNILYRAERDTSAEPGDSSDWTQRSITDELTPAYEWLDGVSVRRCGHVAYLSINAESVKENGMTLATLPAYLAQAKYVYASKVYNGSEYVDCCVMLRDGVIDIINLYGQAIPGVVPAYLRTKDFTIIF